MRRFFGRHRRISSVAATPRKKSRSSRRNRDGRNAALYVEHLEDRRLLAAGDLDTTFGVGGQVADDFGLGKDEEVYASAVQADGKVVVAGLVSSGGSRDFMVARYNVNGSRDTSFGTNGHFILDMGNSNEQVSDIAIDSVGRIVAVGSTSVGPRQGFAVFRLTTGGQLDTTFSGDGMLATVVQNSLGQDVSISIDTHAVALQSDGKIVVGSQTNTSTGPTENDYVLARFNKNGTLDTTFGANGFVITDFGSPTNNSRDDLLREIGIQSDGRIVAVGQSETNIAGHTAFSIARYNLNGSLDTTFGGGDGLVWTDFTPTVTNAPSMATAVRFEPDGQIVVGGWTLLLGNRDFAAARYNSDGSLDTSFGPSSTVPGTVRINLGFLSNTNDEAHDVILQPQPDGKYILGGFSGLTGSTPFSLARLQLNGQLDSSFSGDGRAQVTLPGAARGGSLVMQPSGKIVIAGYYDPSSGTNNVALARFESGLILNTITGVDEVEEGANYTLYLTSSDPLTTQWTINWGDGNVDTFVGSLGSLSHVYADGPNSYTISATVDGTAPVTSKVVAVTNANPSLTVDQGSIVASEGQLATNSGTFGDVPADAVTLSASLGTVVDNGNGTWSWSYGTTDDLPTQAVTITTDDGDGGVTQVTFNLTVNNVSPTLAISGDADVNEGSVYSLNLSSSDPGVDTIASWTINWGDGNIETVSGDPSSAIHTYADGDNSYSISATATDEDGTYSAAGVVAVLVMNVAPVLTISGAVSTDEGSSYTLGLSSSDPGDDTITGWTINWGDGNIETVAGNPSSAAHTYADGDNSYTISATATDEDGTFDSNTLDVTVDNVAPTLAISGATSSDEGSSYTLNLSSSDPGADTIGSWTINWGDGNIETVAGNPSSAAHTYADGDNSYTISATATDEDGTFDSNTLDVTVDNVAPTLAISGAAIADEGSPYTLNLSSSDPGADTIASWTINWGDGNVETVSGNPASAAHTYADGINTYTISATATDEDGTFTAGNTVVVTVENVDPALAISGAAIADEGSSYTLNLSSSDSGSDTITSWTINWGDGNIETVAGNPSSAAHNYADGDNSYTISATATDEDGTFSAGNTVGVNVENVDPTLTISGAASADEASSYTLNLSSSDPGADTIASWTINWGDGNIETVSGSPSSVAHTYADGDNSYTVSATATDEDGTFDSNTLDVTVNNVAPTLAISGASGADEGSSYTLNLSSSDSGTDTITSWTINWGDGNVETVAGNPSSAVHTYADGDNSSTISATATDEDGTFTAGNTVDVTIDNVDPTLAISGGASLNEGSSYTLNLSSSDPGADTIASWTINWGDGNIETVSGNPAAAAHTYADGDNNYTVSATATDEDGTFAAGNTVVVTVDNVDPTLAISGAANANEGSAYMLNLSSSDPGADTIASWTINWGDGNIETVSGNPSSASHTYADGSNSYTISATAIDEDGTYAAGSTVAVVVNNVAPTLAISGAPTVNQDTPYTLNLSSTDPGADTITSWTINWGDGNIQTVAGNPAIIVHVFDNSGNYTITATATDEDGTFASNSLAVTVGGAGVTLIGGVLHIVGTDSNDIVIITKTSTSIMVLASFIDNSPVLFNNSSVTEIQVQMHGGHDIVVTTPTVTKLMTIDGGSGNDLLTGGGGRNVISGGSGHDTLHGGAGDDVLLGGTGNDDLLGGSGNDVLVGGDGNDILDGGIGRDVLIGSQDEDELRGGNDEDILIGGYTVHDNNIAALDAIMSIWGSSASFNSRKATLTASGGLLQANVAVFDDDDDDTIIGGAGRDLIFGDTNPWDGAVDMISLQSSQDVLVAVN